jgi:hypothetical protein
MNAQQMSMKDLVSHRADLRRQILAAAAHYPCNTVELGAAVWIWFGDESASMRVKAYADLRDWVEKITDPAARDHQTRLLQESISILNAIEAKSGRGRSSLIPQVGEQLELQSLGS